MSKNIFFISLLILATACSKRERPAGLYEQGRLEYKIIYLNEDKGSFDPSFLPKKMVLEFNNEYCTNTIDGFLGMFKLNNLTYFGKKKSTTHLKVLDANYVFYGSKSELMCCFEMFEGMKVEYDTATTKSIAGLKSYHATATIPTTGDVFDIFYTYDIALEHPNVTNPYLNIEGVLTDFVLYMGPYKMRFIAQKFSPDKVPDFDLKIPEEAKQVSRDEMVYALERLMEQ